MAWPQGIILGMIVLRCAIVMRDRVEKNEKNGKVAVVAGVIGVLLLYAVPVAVLWWGGFWATHS